MFNARAGQPVASRPISQPNSPLNLATSAVIQKIAAEKAIVAGMVTAQVVSISTPTCQRTLFTRSAAPAPIKAMLITCDVLTGAPRSAEVMMTPAEAT